MVQSDWFSDESTLLDDAPADRRPAVMSDGAPVFLPPELQDLSKAYASPTGSTSHFGDEFAYATVSGAPYKFLHEFDGFGLYEGVRRHPMDRDTTSATFDLLRRMAYGCWVVQAIIRTRINQARRFAKVAPGRFEPGFRVVTRDPDARSSDAAQKRCAELEQFVLHCGWEERPEDQFERPPFATHVARVIEDTLTLDAIAVQLWPGNNPRKYPISEFQAVDPAEIRRTIPKMYKTGAAREIGGAKEPPPRYAHFVQMRGGRPIAEFSRDQLLYITRNSSTWLGRHEYGTSELEVLIRVITGLLFGLDYNVRYFQQNTLPRGFISLVGQYGPGQLEYFRQQWRAMLQGIRNVHRTPIFAMREGQGAEWQPIDMSNRDMEFGQWMEFLINCACMVYLIHPEEIGFRGWSAQKPSLSEGTPVAQLEYGSDKGLVGLLEGAIEAPMDRIIEAIDPDFRFELIGTRQEEWRHWREYQELLFGMGLATPNAVASELDYPLVDERDLYGDAPIGNPVAMELWKQSRGLDQASMQQQMAPPPGMEGQMMEQQGPEADMDGPGTLAALREAMAGGGGGGGQAPETEKSLSAILELVLDD